MRYLSAQYVFPVSGPALKYGIVCVDDDGHIHSVEDTGGRLEEHEKLEFYNGILVPGFVNAHCHLELSHLRGCIAQGVGLAGFIRRVGQLRDAPDDVIVAAARDADVAMRQNGIAATGDVANSVVTKAVKLASGVYYHTFVEVFGLDGTLANEHFTTAHRVDRMFREAGLLSTIVPHALYSVSRRLWEGVFYNYQHQSPRAMSIHFRESADEQAAFLEGRGALADMLRSAGLLTDKNVPGRAAQQKMEHCMHKAQRCLLVHNTYAGVDELLRYAQPPFKTYFVLCPTSNLHIEKRLPHLPDFWMQPELSRKTCFGTDSLASNSELSILSEMKTVMRHFPDIPLDVLMRWATLNGANALGFDWFLGSFDRGKAPGVNLITDVDFAQLRLTDKSAVKVLVESGGKH